MYTYYRVCFLKMLKSKCCSLVRSKKLRILSIIVVLLFCYHNPYFYHEQQQEDEIDIIASRVVIDNKYESMGNPNLGLDQNCRKFFNKFSKYQPQAISQALQQQFDTKLYDRQNWLSSTIRKIKFQLALENIKFTDDLRNQIKVQYKKLIKSLSDHENQLFKDFGLMRVHSRCEGEEVIDLSDFHQKLYPWLSFKFPAPSSTTNRDENDAKNKSYQSGNFLQQLKSDYNGRGIVIPILPVNDNKHIRDQSIINLVGSLRILKNNLPIEIIYFGDDVIDENLLNMAANDDILHVPKSFSEYSSTPFTSSDYPKQAIKFINVTELIADQYHDKFNANFLYSLSLIFNTFEEVILLHHRTIPLINLEILFDNKNYLQTGNLLFKNPTILSTKPRKLKNGYNQVNLLLQSLLPHEKDEQYFNFTQSTSNSTNRLLHQGFQKLVDPSMMIINKSKWLHGLLIATNLQFINLLNGRFHNFQTELNPDFICLGHEISGLYPLNFNTNYAIASGILTPRQSRDKSFINQSEEICSSSWGQLYDEDDLTLLYVTSHQLENSKWHDELFTSALERKYSYYESQIVDNIFDKDSSEKQTLGSINNEIYTSKLRDNPLYIEAIIKPPTLQAPVEVGEIKEPNKAWILQEGFVKDLGNPYYCAYNIVGNLEEGKIGSMITYNQRIQNKFRFVIDFWLQN
jgi:hypothetical protein